MGVGAELQWGWGQEDGLEEGREAEALRSRTRRPRPRRGWKVTCAPCDCSPAQGLLSKTVRPLLSPERKKHNPNVDLT